MSQVIPVLLADILHGKVLLIKFMREKNHICVSSPVLKDIKSKRFNG